MFTNRKEDRPLHLFRWAARVLSVLSTAVLLLFITGEKFEVSRITAKEWVGFALFPVGIVIGFAIGWWKEGLGGAITILSLLAFYLVYGYLRGNFNLGWAFVVFAFPGFLFLISWLLSFTRERRIGTSGHDGVLRHGH